VVERHRQRSLSAIFYFVGLFVLGGFILWIGQGVLVPIVIAAFLCFLIVTVKRRIEKFPYIGPLLPESVQFALAFAVILIVLTVLVAIIRSNIEEVIAAAPGYNEKLREILGHLTEFSLGLPFFGNNLQVALDNIQASAIDLIQGVVGDVAGLARGFLGGLVTVALYTAFMLAERGRLLKKMVIIAGNETATNLLHGVIDDIARLVREYISVKTFTSFIVGSISYVIMLALGIDFAGFWALLIFGLNFIPVIGSIIAVIMPTILALIQPGGGLGLFLLTGISLTAVEQAIGSFVEPRMMGRSLNLSPLIILISLASWGTLWGIPGMFLSVPMTVAMMIIFAQFKTTRPVAVLLSDDGEVAPLQQGESGRPRVAARFLQGRNR
jgi:predicted PurR-regulated permease PerM